MRPAEIRRKNQRSTIWWEEDSEKASRQLVSGRHTDKWPNKAKSSQYPAKKNDNNPRRDLPRCNNTGRRGPCRYQRTKMKTEHISIRNRQSNLKGALKEEDWKKISTTFEGTSHPSPMLKKKKKKPRATPSRRPHHRHHEEAPNRQLHHVKSLRLYEGLTFMEPKVPPPGTKWPGEANGQVLKLIHQRSPSARQPFVRIRRVEHSQDGSEEGSTGRQKTQRTADKNMGSGRTAIPITGTSGQRRTWIEENARNHPDHGPQSNARNFKRPLDIQENLMKNKQRTKTLNMAGIQCSAFPSKGRRFVYTYPNCNLDPSTNEEENNTQRSTNEDNEWKTKTANEEQRMKINEWKWEQQMKTNRWRQRMKYPDLPRWRTTNENLNEESENPITTEDN